MTNTDDREIYVQTSLENSGAWQEAARMRFKGKGKLDPIAPGKWELRMNEKGECQKNFQKVCENIDNVLGKKNEIMMKHRMKNFRSWRAKKKEKTGLTGWYGQWLKEEGKEEGNVELNEKDWNIVFTPDPKPKDEIQMDEYLAHLKRKNARWRREENRKLIKEYIEEFKKIEDVYEEYKNAVEKKNMEELTKLECKMIYYSRRLKITHSYKNMEQSEEIQVVTAELENLKLSSDASDEGPYDENEVVDEDEDEEDEDEEDKDEESENEGDEPWMKRWKKAKAVYYEYKKESGNLKQQPRIEALLLSVSVELGIRDKHTKMDRNLEIQAIIDEMELLECGSLTLTDELHEGEGQDEDDKDDEEGRDESHKMELDN